MFKGFKERLEQELVALDPKTAFGVSAKPYRGYMSWIGGAILADLSSFKPKWVSLQEYQEQGARIVHKKAAF